MLSDSERIDVLKFISKTHRDMHENRIKRELQVVITTLSFYAACVAFKLNKGFSGWQPFFVCLAFIIIASYVYKYLKASGESNNFNQGLSQVSENILLKSLEEPSINDLSDLLKKILEAYENPDKFIKNHEKNKEGRPSANRWSWQAIIVISGAFISIVLIDYVIIGFLFYIIYLYRIQMVILLSEGEELEGVSQKNNLLKWVDKCIRKISSTIAQKNIWNQFLRIFSKKSPK